MASKQLGKFRQWAGEVISVRDKTVVTDEFRELERDIELRRRGLWKLNLASEDYQHLLSRKKESEAVDGEEKLLAIDALGVVMLQHGEEFGDDSAYGVSLVNLGRAHCQVAALQEAFSLQFEDTYLASLRRADDEIKEYQSQRKKLESRRLTYDAAITKLEKIRNSKKEKEKDRQEAEDEYMKAKSRYEDTLEDVRARMYAIQENELDQLRSLTDFLDEEAHFVEQYLEVLKEAKSAWIDEDTLAQMESQRKRRPPPRPANDSRYGSTRSIKSLSRHSPPHSNGSDSNEENQAEGRVSRGISLRKTNSNGHVRSDSRPQSRASRKRSDSTATNGNASEKDVERDNAEREKEKERKRRSVAGWASSKMSSLTHRGKKDKSRSKIDSLMADRDDGNSEDEDERDDRYQYNARQSSAHTSVRSSSHPSTPTIASTVPRILRSSSQQSDRKVVVALHDFAAASSDELSFRAGERIVVLNEVLDGWWMGELDGRTGLFPTTYTEPAKDLPNKPPLPRRPSPVSDPSPLASEDEAARQQPRWLTAANTGLSMQSDDEDHPFSDGYMAPLRAPEGTFYAESITSSVDDYSEDQRLVGSQDESHIDGIYDYNTLPKPSSPVGPPPVPVRGTSVRKPPPPPPPPRRSTISAPAPPAPPVPSRPGIARSNTSTNSSSTTASFVTVATTTATPEVKGVELTFSPFDSPKDATFSIRQGCDNFKQNPFKAPGVCANCFKMHA